MSDKYFKCAKDAKCVGLKKDMKGFHECAKANKCKKPTKDKKPKKVKPPKLPKKTRKEVVKETVADALSEAPEIADIMKATSGSGNPWIEHVKNYQAEHKCSYKEALSGAKKTYVKE